MLTPWCCNTAWMLSGWPEATAFQWATRNARRAQERVLRATIAANRASVFAQEHHFDRIGSIAEFQRRVPMRAYQEFQPYVDRVAAGEPGILTAQPVTCLQPTGGTSGGRKLIPYTGGLQRQFQRALHVWIADLFSKCSGVRAGRAYWSISPALGGTGHTPAGVRIGFADDTEYLGRWSRRMANSMLVAPNWLARIGDLETFKYLTLYHLLLAQDLSLVSVWSPTFLSCLLRDLDRSRERLVDDFCAGGWPSARGPSLSYNAAPPASIPVLKRRGDFLRGVLTSSADLSMLLPAIWPRLALVSCWADSAAAGPFEALKQSLPSVKFQPKGLLATEGFISIPLCDQPAPALAVRSHFFEFLERDATTLSASPRLAHELEVGGAYEVVLTTAGGLYRYRLGDQIEVVGRMGTCPLVRFTGRVDDVVDLVGEKVAAAHVEAILLRLWQQLGFQPAFSLLTPLATQPPRYRLYLQDQRLTNDLLTYIARCLEDGLADNPYYRHAVGLGQLAPAEAGLLDPTHRSGWDLVCEHRVEAGQRLGDIKPTVLDGSFPAAQLFDPWLIATATSVDEPSSHTTSPTRGPQPSQSNDAGEPTALRG